MTTDWAGIGKQAYEMLHGGAEKVAAHDHVYVTGLPGAGKTTEGERLAKDYNLPLISLDGVEGMTHVDDTAALTQQLIDSLDERSVIEGVQLLGLQDKLQGQDVRYLDADLDTLATRLVSRGYEREPGKVLRGTEYLTDAKEWLRTFPQLRPTQDGDTYPYPDNAGEKQAASAPGIPDRGYYGDVSRFKPGELKDFVIQLHDAIKAKRHRDIRIGDEKGLHSWVSRSTLPVPGERQLAIHQPMHSYAHGTFEGEIPRGQYGAGKVKVEDKGKILITSAHPDKIEFTRADKQHPQRYVLLKPPGFGRDKDWLLINNTPREQLPYQKVHYQRIPAEQVEQQIAKMQEGDSLEVKRDGASSLIKLLDNRVEVMSYRADKSGQPIIHTEKLTRGHKFPIPKELQGTVLKGELYGERDGEAIHPQELGGILNATLANALEKMDTKGIKLKNMLYDVQRYGKDELDPDTTPRLERRKMLAHVLQHLPPELFTHGEAADSPDDAKALWERVKSRGYAPDNEGVVYWPAHGKPMKSKLLEDTDVHITDIFPGLGKYQGRGAGGFAYATQPGGPTVGRVGTGLSDEMRERMYASPQDFIGRVARVKSQPAFPSGALRAPALIALHEDIGKSA